MMYNCITFAYSELFSRTMSCWVRQHTLAGVAAAGVLANCEGRTTGTSTWLGANTWGPVMVNKISVYQQKTLSGHVEACVNVLYVSLCGLQDGFYKLVNYISKVDCSSFQKQDRCHHLQYNNMIFKASKFIKYHVDFHVSVTHESHLKEGLRTVCACSLEQSVHSFFVIWYYLDSSFILFYSWC